MQSATSTRPVPDLVRDFSPPHRRVLTCPELVAPLEIYVHGDDATFQSDRLSSASPDQRAIATTHKIHLRNVAKALTKPLKRVDEVAQPPPLLLKNLVISADEFAVHVGERSA